MKTIAFFLILFITYSCGIEYDGETRLVVETHVKDTDGNPLAGKNIAIMTSHGQYSDEISNGTTNSQGKSLLIFPAPKADSANVHIQIIEDDIYQGKYLRNLKKEDFINYKLAQELILFRHDQITTLAIVIEQNPALRFNGYTIDVETAEEVVDFGDNQGVHYFNNSAFRVLKNQTANLQYSVTDMNTMITTQSVVDIPIGEEPVEFTLAY